MIGVIPAAGRGTRAYPYSTGIPKGMLDVGGRPLLERTVGILRDQLAVERIVIVVNRDGGMIRAHFGDGARFGVPIVYVENDAVERGLGYSLLLARPFVREHCVVVLADECYLDTNHHALLSSGYRDALAVCAVQVTEATELIERNYAVHGQRGRATSIEEKPARPTGAMLGLGTFVLSRDFFQHLHDAVHASGSHQPSDPVSVLGRLCRRGQRIDYVPLEGRYVNVNDRDALNLARSEVRSHRFNEMSLGLAVMAKGSLSDTIRTLDEFLALQLFTQVVLVAPPGTPPERMPAGVTIVSAAGHGYGDMMRAGFESLGTDIMLCALSDGSCRPRDVSKFLAYVTDADAVVGTRTTRQLIDQGTNMRGIVRAAHIVLAKLLDVIWWQYEARFTDVGCTYRAIWRSTYDLIAPHVRSRGPEYAVEILIEILRARRRVIEIPVSYAVRRPGRPEPDQSWRTFVAILKVIVHRRVEAAAGRRSMSPPVTVSPSAARTTGSDR